MANNDPKDPKRKKPQAPAQKDDTEANKHSSVPVTVKAPDDEETLVVKLNFLRQVIDFEELEWVAPFDVLTQAGIALPPPEELDDAQLSTTLWEVIHALALLGAYLVHTDHLSDRELYEELWRDMLHDAAVLRPDDPDYGYFIDLVGSGSEEDSALYLKYYADEEDREQWAEDWSGPLPVPEPLPFDRDRRLPSHENLQIVGPGKA